MGRPSHYSLEIALRCQRLIEGLEPHIGENSQLVEQWGGPLRTTFLLAMSTPMLLLPLERIFKPSFSAKQASPMTAHSTRRYPFACAML